MFNDYFGFLYLLVYTTNKLQLKNSAYMSKIYSYFFNNVLLKLFVQEGNQIFLLEAHVVIKVFLIEFDFKPSNSA